MISYQTLEQLPTQLYETDSFLLLRKKYLELYSKYERVYLAKLNINRSPCQASVTETCTQQFTTTCKIVHTTRYACFTTPSTVINVTCFNTRNNGGYC